MASRDAGDPARGTAGARTAAGYQLLWLAKGREPELVRVLLKPFEPALLAIDAQLQSVLVAGRDLARPEHALGPALEAQHHVVVVVEPAAGHEAGKVGGDLRHRQPGDEGEKVEGVRADIAERAAGAGLFRIDPPFRLLGAGVLGSLGQPVLDIFRLNDADRAKRACRHHFARLPHQRIAGVVVGEKEDAAGASGDFRQCHRILQPGGQRLFADDVEAGFEEGFRRRVVQVVGGDDRHGLDAIGARGLGCRHVLEGGIGAIRRDAALCCRGAGAVRVGREGAGNEIELAIDPCGDAVYGADEGALSAADHAQPQRPLRPCRSRCRYHVVSPLPLGTCGLRRMAPLMSIVHSSYSANDRAPERGGSLRHPHRIQRNRRMPGRPLR